MIAAIDTAASHLEDWEAAFSENLLFGPLPEMSPRLLPDSDEPEGHVSEEQNLQFLFQAAKQLQGGHEPAADSPSPDDHLYATSAAFTAAQTSLEQESFQEQQEQLTEVGLFVTC